MQAVNDRAVIVKTSDKVNSSEPRKDDKTRNMNKTSNSREEKMSSSMSFKVQKDVFDAVLEDNEKEVITSDKPEYYYYYYYDDIDDDNNKESSATIETKHYEPLPTPPRVISE